MKPNVYLSQSNILLHVVITLAGFLCYYNSLQNGLVHDDKFAVENNPDVFGKTEIVDVFFNDFWGESLKSPKSHKSFRPLCTLTFRLNHYFHGFNPFGYHLVNVLLHVLVCNYFFYLLQEEVFKEKMPSFFATLMFSTHPVHVEAVSCSLYCSSANLFPTIILLILFP